MKYSKYSDDSEDDFEFEDELDTEAGDEDIRVEEIGPEEEPEDPEPIGEEPAETLDEETNWTEESFAGEDILPEDEPVLRGRAVRRKRNPARMIVPIAVALVLVAAAAVAIYIIVFQPNTATVKLSEYLGINDGEIAVFLDNERVEVTATEHSGSFYLPLEFVTANISDKFYYDRESDGLLFTTATKIYHIPLNGTDYTITTAEADKTENESFMEKIAYREDDTIYLSMFFVATFEADTVCFEHFDDPQRLYLFKSDIDLATILWQDTTVTVRTEASIKAPIVSSFAGTDTEEIYWMAKESGADITDWVEVTNMDGRHGYVAGKEIREIAGGSYVKTLAEKEEYPNLCADEDVILGWHGVYDVGDNTHVEELTAEASSLTVISPTWYKVVSAEGEITSMADASYVEYVHSIGLKIWPLISDFTSAGEGWDETQMLSSATARARIIDTLINEAASFGYDGWNIDFEKVPTDAGDDFIEFIRELSIACRYHGLVLSVDNYVPREHTAHYNRAGQGECVDYVIVMGYDEHWAGCEEAGSTASLPFVTEGLDATLEMVPAEKVINGVPFYTRLWMSEKDEAGNVTLTSVAYGMQAALDKIEELGLTATWDEELGQFVAAGTVDNVYYSIWLEEEDSMRVRITAVREREIAGIAAWALGFEKDSIWEILRKK